MKNRVKFEKGGYRRTLIVVDGKQVGYYDSIGKGPIFAFLYRANVDNGRAEFAARFKHKPVGYKTRVAALRDLFKAVLNNLTPDQYLDRLAAGESPLGIARTFGHVGYKLPEGVTLGGPGAPVA